MGIDRRVVPDGSRRRWVHGVGGEPPANAERLLRHGQGRTRRWSALGRAAGSGVDQVDAEELLWELVDAGLVAVHERMRRNGDWEPYQWVTTPEGSDLLHDTRAHLDIDSWLSVPDPPDHPVLCEIRRWLETLDKPVGTAVHVVAALGDELRAGRIPRGRLLSIVVGGHTKAVRIERYRDTIEEATGLDLEAVVRTHGRSVLAYGPFSFTVRGQKIDGQWSIPWLALTPETLKNMERLEVIGKRLLTVENLVAFEEESRLGLPDDTIAIFTGGIPHKLEIEFLQRLCQNGIGVVDHWGDLDVGGLRILRYLQRKLTVPVRPFRMQAQLLQHLPTRSLTARDIASLEAWLEDKDAPCQELAAALLSKGVKAEQEGWYLLSESIRSAFSTEK